MIKAKNQLGGLQLSESGSSDEDDVPLSQRRPPPKVCALADLELAVCFGSNVTADGLFSIALLSANR